MSKGFFCDGCSLPFAGSPPTYLKLTEKMALNVKPASVVAGAQYDRDLCPECMARALEEAAARLREKRNG